MKPMEVAEAVRQIRVAIQGQKREQDEAEEEAVLEAEEVVAKAAEQRIRIQAAVADIPSAVVKKREKEPAGATRED